MQISNQQKVQVATQILKAVMNAKVHGETQIKHVIPDTWTETIFEAIKAELDNVSCLEQMIMI